MIRWVGWWGRARFGGIGRFVGLIVFGVGVIKCRKLWGGV
jgi:hypothetical protein